MLAVRAVKPGRKRKGEGKEREKDEKDEDVTPRSPSRIARTGRARDLPACKYGGTTRIGSRLRKSYELQIHLTALHAVPFPPPLGLRRLRS